MKVSTIKSANTKSQNAGRAVRNTAVTVATESIDAAWLVGSSVLSFFGGIFISAPELPKVNERIVRDAVAKRKVISAKQLSTRN